MSARRIAVAVLSAGLVAALAGCASSSTQAINGASTPMAVVSRVEVLDMPPGFGHILTACHEGNRIYQSEYGEGYSGSPLVVVAADPTCAVGA